MLARKSGVAKQCKLLKNLALDRLVGEVGILISATGIGSRWRFRGAGLAP